MATSSWVRQPRRFQAVRRSASSWPMSWPAAIPGRPSISSTSLPPACMWPMSTVWSRCWISSLMRAIRSSSLSTISTSSNAPTISSTSAPRAAAAAAPSSPPATPEEVAHEPALLRRGSISGPCWSVPQSCNHRNNTNGSPSGRVRLLLQRAFLPDSLGFASQGRFVV